jgi:hypothetical protein
MVPRGHDDLTVADPGCVKTTSQIEIVSGVSETIDATVH